MPKRTDIRKVLIIGSGPIQIGQAAEFDYSGSQACLSLREEGIKTILVNNNPATIQTDTDIADVVYLEPLTPESIENIIKKERPDGLLPNMGGQTGLNLTVELDKLGILKKYNVEILGVKSIETIKNAEGRLEFAELMRKIGEPVCKSRSVFSLHEAEEAAFEIGYPVIIRPGFTLGGTGGGIAFNEKDLAKVVQRAISRSKNGEALVEEYVGGWKEIEYEVMRDANDNCITICNMENFDPMGIHTGESIVVAPTQTLTDTEYQMLRSASLNIIRALGVQGGCNVQFGLHPEDPTKYRVIEVNPRVSRSSALASKATGYPIARVSAKIAIGMTLDEIANEVTKTTPASFEPALDYIVTKIPRWPFDKFRGIPRTIGTEMKSTGEVMSIGRTFEESLQKAIRSLDQKRMGLCADGRKEETDDTVIKENLEHATDARIYYVYDALKKGWPVDEVYRLTKIDKFFLEKILNIVNLEKELAGKKLDEKLLLKAKKAGFSDFQISKLSKTAEMEVRKKRKSAGVTPTYKMVDTCAAEFEAKTPYYYSSYESENEAVSSDRKKIIILGSGPIRIGQGVEFDYCTVHAVLALRELGYEAIIINNNPETVSTDFDTSDKLYFEPLTVEDVLNIVDIENKNLLGVMVQFGGQTAINITKGLSDAGVKILGTQPDDIDLSENRDRFGKLLKKLGIPAPEFGMANSFDEALEVAKKLGYPVLARPSYVLGGRAMEIVFNDEDLEEYMRHAAEISPDRPIRIDKFLDDAVEIDVDAISDGTDVYIGGIMEHIEEAGIHSGDACCVVPPQTLGKKVLKDLDEYTKKIALSLRTVGLINLQYAVKDGVVYVIEANQRSSRTIPFISKATGVPMAKIAARVVMGEKLKDIIKDFDYLARVHHVAVKEVVLPFDKLRIDPILSPEMRSTGESMGINHNFGNAYYKAQTGAGLKLPDKGNVFVSVRGGKQQEEAAKLARELERLGFDIYATEGTADAISKQGVEVKVVKKVHEGSPNAIDMIQGKDLHFIINVPKRGEKAQEDEKKIRFAILDYDIPYVTTMAAARAAVDAIRSARGGDVETRSLNEYFE